jgi:WD40 repeat protein
MSPAADPPKAPDAKISFYRDIRPIFQQQCQGCHQPAKPQGGFIITRFADLLKPGENGAKPAVVPGKPTESDLLDQVVSKNGKPPKMPQNADPLPQAHIEKIRLWIAQGATDDTPPSARQIAIDADHMPVYQLPPVITSLDYSPDGQLLAVSGYHEVLLHKADGSGIVARFVGASERIQKVAFSPDGKLLAVAGGNPGRFGEIQVWDVTKKQLKFAVSYTYDTINGVSWSPDGKMIAFGCNDNTLRGIDSNTGKQILFQGAHNDWVLDTAFGSDGKFLVSASRDRTLKLTEVATQRFIDNVTSITPGALKGGLAAVACRPFKEKKIVKAANIAVASTEEKVYEELLFGGADGRPKLYKMHRESKRVIGDDANKVREYEAMPGRVFAIRFNADGKLFAAGSSSDGNGEVRIYQTDDGKVVSRFEGIKGGIYALAYRPDGTQVASGGFDGVVRFHNPATGKLVKEFVPVPITTKSAAR